MMGRFAFLIPFILLVAACSSEPVTVDRDMRRTIDTLFRAQRDALAPSLDTLCIRHYDSLYPLLLDSIVRQRERERDVILKSRQ